MAVQGLRRRTVAVDRPASAPGDRSGLAPGKRRVTLFRADLVALILALAASRLVVGTHHGWNLLPVFFGSNAEMSWPGPFDLDFMAFLSGDARILLLGTDRAAGR